MIFILLAGAGFSRNWGVWLANETFEYFLGCKKLDVNLRHILWNSKITIGGFEDALPIFRRSINAGKIRSRKNRCAIYRPPLSECLIV